MSEQTTYRHCNSCSYQGLADTFIEKTEIVSETPAGACINMQIHCPGCNSTDISDHFTDPFFMNKLPAAEPVIIDQPGKVKRTRNLVDQLMIYPNAVSIKHMPNRKIAVVEVSEEDPEGGVIVELLRADLSKDLLNSLPKENQLRNKVQITAFKLSDSAGMALAVALNTYYTTVKHLQIPKVIIKPSQ